MDILTFEEKFWFRNEIIIKILIELSGFYEFNIHLDQSDARSRNKINKTSSKTLRVLFESAIIQSGFITLA